MRKVTLYLSEDLVNEMRVLAARRKISFQEYCRAGLLLYSLQPFQQTTPKKGAK
jgi:hypothetical protein